MHIPPVYPLWNIKPCILGWHIYQFSLLIMQLNFASVHHRNRRIKYYCSESYSFDFCRLRFCFIHFTILWQNKWGSKTFCKSQLYLFTMIPDSKCRYVLYFGRRILMFTNISIGFLFVMHSRQNNRPFLSTVFSTLAHKLSLNLSIAIPNEYTFNF